MFTHMKEKPFYCSAETDLFPNWLLVIKSCKHYCMTESVCVCGSVFRLTFYIPFFLLQLLTKHFFPCEAFFYAKHSSNGFQVYEFIKGFIEKDNCWIKCYKIEPSL